MAALLVSSQLLQKNIATRPLPLWERACSRWQRRWFQAKARWQASSYREASQSAPSHCGSGLARDGSTAGFKAKLAGKPAPTEKHRNPPLPLWERACPRWQRRWFQGKARWQASSYRKASQSAPSSCGSGLARDGSAAVFKPAPSDKYRYLRATFRSTCTRACPFAGHSRPAAALGFNSKPVLFYILATNP